MKDNNELINIAKGILPEKDKYAEQTKSQLKLFMLCSAKKELEKVAELSNTLDKLMSIYQDKAFEYIRDNPESALSFIPVAVDTISKCLDRSYKLINQVAGDDKLADIVFLGQSNTEININNMDPEEQASVLSDPRSRERVKQAIDIISDMIMKETSEDTIIVESDEEDQ